MKLGNSRRAIEDIKAVSSERKLIIEGFPEALGEAQG